MNILPDRKIFGDISAPVILLYVCDSDEMENADKVYDYVCSLTERRDWALLALGVSSWFDCLSPWNAPPVFGKIGFGNGASQTLSEILEILKPYEKKCVYLCGYSLAGLFALWASTQSSLFSGVCAASPSVWFPSWLDFASENPIKASNIYLSLGDREEKTKNPVMATVGQCIKKQQEMLIKNGKNCLFEWNSGNHFQDSDLRTAKGMAWLLGNI